MSQQFEPQFYESSKGFRFYATVGKEKYQYDDDNNAWVLWPMEHEVFVRAVERRDYRLLPDNPAPSASWTTGRLSGTKTKQFKPISSKLQYGSENCPKGWHRSEHDDYFNSHWQVSGTISRNMRSGKWSLRIHNNKKPLMWDIQDVSEGFDIWVQWANENFPFYLNPNHVRV